MPTTKAVEPLIVQRSDCAALYKELGLSAAGTWSAAIMKKHINSLPKSFDQLLGSKAIASVKNLDLCNDLVAAVESGRPIKIQNGDSPKAKKSLAVGKAESNGEKDVTDSELISSRTAKLAKVEKEIHKRMVVVDSQVESVGELLAEIRDAELWMGAYSSWSQYLKKRCWFLTSQSFSQASRMLAAVEIRKRLPDKPSPVTNITGNLNTSHLMELSRLVPDKVREDGVGREKDFDKLSPTTVSRVLKKSLDDAHGDMPTAADVRKYVSVELKKTKQPEPSRNGVDLVVFLKTMSNTLQELLSRCQEQDPEMWDEMQREHVDLIPNAARCADELSAWLYQSQNL